MRLCFIGKWPPIQGGVSRTGFWDAHALAEAGHEIHVVTNAAEVEPEYRINEDAYLHQAGTSPTLGARIHVHHPDVRTARAIPYANPFVTKLAGAASQVAREVRPDLLYGYYLEPYGSATALASTWTGVPYGLRHAGSDVSLLARHPALRAAFDHLARGSDFWLDTDLSYRRAWQRYGVPADSFYAIGRYSLPTDFFRPGVEPLRIGEFGELDESAATVGVYGKVGESKGSFDLLHAFGEARRRVGAGNLVLATSAAAAQATELRTRAAELDINLLILPFMPHWRVPSFIAACDAVAYLERDFSVSMHRPLVPREVLACGGCLVISPEAADRLEYRDRLRDGGNCFIVEPRDHVALASTLECLLRDPGRARRVGEAGHQTVSRHLEDWPGYVSAISQTFEQIRRDVQRRRQNVSVAELQAALARLSADEPFREWFNLAPDSALSKYGLSGEEKAALKAIDRKMLGLFSQAVRENRRERVLKHFPLTTAATERQVKRLFDRYHDLRPAGPRDSPADDARAFGSYLVDCLTAESGPSAASWAADLCRYEAIFVELSMEPLPTEDPLAGAPPRTCPRHPRRASGIRCLRFGHDVARLAEMIEDGEVPGEVPAETVYVVARAVPFSATPQTFRVSAEVAHLLDLCDGTSSAEDVAQTVAQAVAGPDEELDAAIAAAYEAIGQLVAAGLVEHAPERSAV